jgi:DNA segregation ATPase FtsK/SpoIIIE, S-DNA-T family
LSRITELTDQIQRLEREINTAEARLRGIVELGRRNQAALDGYFERLLVENQQALDALLEPKPVHQIGGWQASQWATWDADQASQVVKLPGPQLVEQLKRLRIGDLVETRTTGPLRCSLPAYVPFIGCNRTVVIRTQGELSRQTGEELLQSLVIRTALLLPHQTAYVLLDPSGSGRAFPMRRYLPMVQENSGDVRRDLEAVLQDIERIYADLLDAATRSFDQIAPDIRINERFRFVFAANFPYQYDRRAIEAMQSVSRNGPEAGTYLFIHYNTDHELPRDISMSEFQNAFYVDLDSNSRVTRCRLELIPDAGDKAATPDRQNDVFDRLSQAKLPEREIPFDGYVAIPPERWWTYSTDSTLRTPIGASGARDVLEIWFGEDENGRPCVHGMLGAMTGAGKSNLYHVLILGLCTRYSPDELQLYLIDGKDGVEFQIYRDLPHARVVSLNSPSELSRSVLAELIDEQERRNAMFTAAGVKDFTSYRTYCQDHAGDASPPRYLPRILLLVDEYQELFDGDSDGMASVYLRQLAQQGRSAGIHMLLGSQRFGAVGMLNQTDIFGNIHLRMAMQMTSSNIQALTEFGRHGKQLIMRCDLPGKIVVNDRSGDDKGNTSGKVAFFERNDASPDRRLQIIQQLAQFAEDADETTQPERDGKRGLTHVPTTIVFDGKEQPQIIENPYVEELLESKNKTWYTAAEIEALARRPIHENGLGMNDWFAAERPHVLWLGQEYTVLGQAMAIIRRATGEHVLIVGGANAPRYGMVAASVVSLALTAPPTHARFVIVDRSVPGTDWHTTLPDVVKHVLNPAGYPAVLHQEKKGVDELLDRLVSVLDHRLNLPEARLVHEPSVFVVMTELDRIDDLRRRADAYGMSDSPLGEKLQRLYLEGSPLGIHLVLSFNGVRPMLHVLDERRGLENFRHRVGLQMSEDESLTFVRSRKAAQLQLEGPTPISALYMDMEYDRSVRFKPYSIDTAGFTRQLSEIGQRLSLWSKQQ